MEPLIPVRPAVVCVVRYDPDWRRRFDAERLLLEETLAAWLDGGIHHVGSTSVPGLAAKPSIDMIAGVRDFEEARAAYGPLRSLRYAHTPHRPGIAHHFSKRPATFGDVAYGLHLTEPGSDLWRERLAFRDALRGDPALAAAYEALKRALAREFPDDVGSYTAGKRAFVARVLASAGLRPGRR